MLLYVSGVMCLIRRCMLRQLQDVASIKDIEGDDDPEVVGGLGACDDALGELLETIIERMHHTSLVSSQWASGFTKGRGCWTSLGICTQVCSYQIHADTLAICTTEIHIRAHMCM